MLSSATPFGVVREHVEALMEAGEPFAAVERAIAATRLPEDERAALWLLAWSLRRDEHEWITPTRRPVLRPVEAEA